MASRTKRPDRSNTRDAVERLLALYEHERGLYADVLALAREQAGILERGGAMTEIRGILERKRRCLDEIARLEAEDVAAAPETWSSEDRTRLLSARARITALVEEITAWEERNDQALLVQTGLI